MGKKLQKNLKSVAIGFKDSRRSITSHLEEGQIKKKIQQMREEQPFRDFIGN